MRAEVVGGCHNVTNERSSTVKLPVKLTQPLYTLAESARLLGTPTSTLTSWARGYDYPTRSGEIRHSEPLVTETGRRRRGHPTVPFIGFAEATLLAEIRRTGVPMQRIRPAIEKLRNEMGIEHALASQQIYTDGAEVLRKISSDASASERPEFVVIRNNQGVLAEAIENYARQVTFGPSGYAEVIRLPRFGSADVIVDPRLGFGQPVLEDNGVAVEAILDRFDGGESITSLATDFAISESTVEQLLRASRQVAA